MIRNNYDTILILDFNSHYSQRIARRIRALNVYSKIVDPNISVAEIKKEAPQGIILVGGSPSIRDIGAERPKGGIYKMGIPIFGIGYGLQLIADAQGGEVAPSFEKTGGQSTLTIEDPHSSLLKGVNSHSKVWLPEGDLIHSLGDNFKRVGSTPACPYAVVENSKEGLYGTQFSIGSSQTEEGDKILSNFLFNICHCEANWNMEAFIDDKIEEIKAIVGRKQVLCGLSGGVDSSVVATLIHRAIGDQLVCVFVNNGLLRKGEPDLVLEVFRDNFNIRLQYADAENLFLSHLKGVSDPEEKRKIIGRLFIEVFEKEARAVGDIAFLAQGTLYTDVLESLSSDKSVRIKSHHNTGGLPEDLKFTLLEPLKELFKDEVRILGKTLGLPDEIVYRHPFPGPGLAVRCVGEVTKERLDTLREIDAIYIEELREGGLYGEIWQALACLLPVKSVGVRDGKRSYEEVCSLRAVLSEDAVTADWYHFPPEILQKISSRICKEVPKVNRVLYDITSKPPGTIEWE